MGLNDKLKGSYYKNYEATLASRTAIHNILDELKNYYNNLIDLINNTYDKITVSRTEMIEKLNAILVKINYIEYSINNFQLEVDSSIEEKLKMLIENYDNDFVTFMETYDTNLYNHSNLTDKASSNIINYTQPLSEYEKSVEKVSTDIGIRWFGGKFNDKHLLNKLNGLLHIVKSNKYEGLTLEDYINSNLILDIFIYSTKGITWLKLGKNSTFGYNIQVKYHSLKYSGINIKLESNSYYTPRDYDINEFDLNMLINLGYGEEDLKNGNVYIKVKTNLPSNTFSGLDEYYISGSTSINEYNDNRVIKNLGRRHIAHNNRDYGYNIDDTIKTLDELRKNNKKYDRETDYISDFVTDKYSKQNRVSNNNFEIYTEISPVNEYGNEQNIIRGTTKRITDDKEIVGIDNSISPIIVNCDKTNKVNYNKTYLDDSDKLMNKEDEKENILYNENKQRVDLLDYRNVGEDIGLIVKNENTFVINNSVNDNNSVTINGNANLIKEAKNPAILNEITNNAILDINSNNSLTEEAFEIADHSALFKPGFKDWIVIKQEKDPYGNIVVLAKNVTENQNDYSTSISKIKNINEIYSINYMYNVYDFLFLENGNMYLFTDEGIKYISKENYENDNFVYENTNILSAKFTTACLTEDKKSFYTVSDQGTYSYDADKQNYRLTNFFYIYDPETLLIKDYGDYCDLKNLDDSAIRYENTSDIEMMESSSKGFKLLKWESGSKWVLLNKTSESIYISKNENFGYFEKTGYSNIKFVDIYNELLYSGIGYGEDLIELELNKKIEMNKDIYHSKIDIPIQYSCLTVIGNTVIAGGNGLYYSEDNGHTWNKSNIEYESCDCLTVIGNTVIAGGNGLYYSEDNGHTWNQSNNTSDSFYCLTVIGSTVIAGGYGLYYSEDNGHTWNQSNITYDEFRCLTVIGSTVIAGSDSGEGGSYLLLYSEDNGHTWIESSNVDVTFPEFSCLTTIGNTVIAGSSYDGILYSEDNGHTWNKSNIEYESCDCLTVIGNTVIAGGNGLYYSEDNGHTWNQSNNKTSDFRCLTVIGNTVIAGGNGLYYSEDNGHTWNQSNNTFDSFYCLTVIGSTVISGGVGLFYSENNGKIWEKNKIYGNSGDFNCLAAIGSTVIAGSNWNGLFYSEDNGKTWEKSNIINGVFHCLTTINSTIIASCYSNGDSYTMGLYYSEDNGHTWFRSNIISGNFQALTVIGSTVIAGGDDIGSYDRKGLYYSEDNGKTWKESNITSRSFNCLTVIGNIVIAGGNGLYYSEDNGHTWNQSNIITGDFKSLTVIGNTVIAASNYNDGLYYSEDNGETWNQSNITSGNFQALTVIGSTVIAGSDYNGRFGNGLYYSEDNGKTWNQSNITSGVFICLAATNTVVMAGSGSNGLYYSKDNGHTWNKLNIDSDRINCLTVFNDEFIMGSGSDKGIYCIKIENNYLKIYKATTYEENTIDKFKRKIQLDSFETILDEQDLPTLESELTTPLKYYNGGLFEINGNTYIIGKDITDFVYVNGYYYALIPSGKVIYKLNKDKTLVSKITHPDWDKDYVSLIKLFSINNNLLIVTSQTNPFSEGPAYYEFPIYTDKETIKAHPELYNDDTNKLSIITDNSKN